MGLWSVLRSGLGIISGSFKIDKAGVKVRFVGRVENGGNVTGGFGLKKDLPEFIFRWVKCMQEAS